MEEYLVTHPVQYLLYDDGKTEEVSGHIVDELLLTLYINGQEWVTFVCSSGRLNAFVFGFLISEGIISSLDDVLLMRVCPEDGVVDVRLVRDVEPPASRVLTSGCGGGTTFSDLTAVGEPVKSGVTLGPNQVLSLMDGLYGAAEAYKKSRGIHTAALSDGKEMLIVAEDIGRHNTLDRLRGEALLRGIDTADKIVLSSGRITSEMLRKTAQMRVPIAISRTSASSLSVSLAEAWGITLIGYAQGQRFRVYTHPWRVK